MRLYEYRISTHAEYDIKGNVTVKPTTLVSGEDYYENTTDAREELLMANAKAITDAGGRNAVEVVVRPFQGN